MKEQKLECLVEGYEGTYFEVGQVWETRGGYRLKIKRFDLKADVYKIIMVSDDLIGNYYYTSEGKKIQGFESELDLVRLIPTETTPSEEPQSKTLSEYLKENNAYESFVENCVASFLEDKDDYHKIKLENDIIYFGNAFNWGGTKEGHIYWYSLHNNQPENLVYNMNEIVFAEVDKRIAEQKSTIESEPKTLSEYLKENNAYESFVENCVEWALENPLKDLKRISQFRNISDFFNFGRTQEGWEYWCDLQSNAPKRLIYDVHRSIFAEVDKIIAKQKSTKEEFNQTFQLNPTTKYKVFVEGRSNPKKYMVFVEGRSNPKKIHDSYNSAEKEAKRLSAKEIGCNVFVVEIVKTFKSKVIVEEMK